MYFVILVIYTLLKRDPMVNQNYNKIPVRDWLSPARFEH